MKNSPSRPASPDPARRRFLRRASAAGAAALVLPAAAPPPVHAAGSDVLKVGLVGCGGRGTGAASQALHADPGARLVAMADAFRDKLDRSLERLQAQQDVAKQIAVDEDHKFVGLDAYRPVIEASDVVILATPPGFRPAHLRAAVEAGKHIFTEKPMATDSPGARSVFESVALSKQQPIAVVAGFCWRYDWARCALFERVHDGAIGELRAVYGTYLTGPVKPMPPETQRPAGLTDLQWMVRNWYNFTWLSGDGFVEQAIHTVDWVAWAFRDNPPASCTGLGGRQIPAEGGNIYDHLEVNYVWDNEARGFVAQRQIRGCYNENSLYILGSRGVAKIARRGVEICDLAGATTLRYDGPKNNMYQTEHDELFKSIRSGKLINDGERMAKSTLMGIMGRIAGYTGQQITWDMALNSQERLVPEITDGWNTPVQTRPMARPGITKYV